jgi:hypothetical protein
MPVAGRATGHRNVMDRQDGRSHVASSPLDGPHDEMAPSVVGASKSRHVAWRLKQRQSGHVRQLLPRGARV